MKTIDRPSTREKPILMSGPMVRAILDGRKSMTRRVVKPQPIRGVQSIDFHESSCLWLGVTAGEVLLQSWHCPYGVPGDRLWVRETWQSTADMNICHKADTEIVYKATDPDWSEYDHWRWRPSIYMPRWASRITLEVTAVRVERLQEISPADARAEGIASVELTESQERQVCQRRSAAQFNDKPELVNDMDYAAVQKYAVLWDSINGKKYPWASNSWVWVIEFKRIKP